MAKADPWSAPYSPTEPDPAIEHFRSKIPVTDDEWEELDGDARKLAFRVSGVAQLDLVTDVHEALADAIENGTSFEDFKAQIGDQLTAAWGGENPSRIETIFRTNLQTAYSYGRYKAQAESKKTHPIWRFDAVMDSRTSDICADLDGTTLDADDAFWDEHQPPLHYNCRSTIVAMTYEDGVDDLDDDAPDTDADEGFGAAPDLDWHPDLDDYPDDLAAIFADRDSDDD